MARLFSSMTLPPPLLALMIASPGVTASRWNTGAVGQIVLDCDRDGRADRIILVQVGRTGSRHLVAYRASAPVFPIRIARVLTPDTAFHLRQLEPGRYGTSCATSGGAGRSGCFMNSLQARCDTIVFGSYLSATAVQWAGDGFTQTPLNPAVAPVKAALRFDAPAACDNVGTVDA